MTPHRLIACLLVALSACFATTVHAAESKPNFLLILVDDVGWAEFGFQGAKDIPTPRIDSIASGGIRFTQGYVAATYCSPCRAGLMTGRYPTRFGHEFNSVANQAGLDLKETTMANRLKAAGYSTCAVGKWHLGEKPEYHPTKRGFDEFYGTLSNTPYYHPRAFVDSRISEEIQKITDNDFYTTDAYGDRAVDWLDKQKDKPWFLYLPFNAQHGPLQAPQKYLDKFAHIQDENRRTFAAMMSALDENVGKVLDKVRSMGQEENTFIVFLSDNGGPTRQTTSNNLPLRGFKGMTLEGGTRVPFCMQWKGKLPAGKTVETPIIQLDVLPTFLAAAGVSIDPAWKLDGVDLMPFLKGANTAKPHETLYWRFGEQWAVRHGDHKLVKSRQMGEPQLFDLASDIGEAKDLSADQPDRVKELRALYDAWDAEQAPPSVPRERLQNRRRQPAT